MKFKFFLPQIALSFIVSNLLWAEEPPLLKTEDIHKIMDQILSQHVENNEVTSSLIKNSLKAYIEQFDPYRTYLLEDEVKPYLHLSKADLDRLVKEYQESKYTTYENLETLFKNSILRARKIRDQFEKENPSYFGLNQSLKPEQVDELLDNKGYSKDEKELFERIKNQFVVLIQAEKKRYGQDYVLSHQKTIFETYEKRLRAFENPYFNQNEQEGLLSEKETENLFVMHVLKSLASSLDAHTEFFNPAEAYDMKMHLQNSFQGIGVSLQDSPEGITISGLVPGSPAAKTDLLKVDDVILEVNGKNVSEEQVESVAKMLQGEIGTSVTLLIKRKVLENQSVKDHQIKVTLKREPVSVDQDRVISTFERYQNGIIGQITLNSFYQNNQGISSEKDVKDAILKLKKEGDLIGLVLDLRENTGGFLSQAVKVAGLFITNGVVVISKYSNGEEKFFRDLDGKTTYTGPLIILTSKMTASAAEIVAQALQDYGVGIVVGDERTYGKGTVQTQTVTQDGASSYFKVTIGKYYTVSGNTPQIEGVIPDLFVPGKYNYEKIGEAYLGSHTLQHDKIAPEFEDDLSDVEPSSKNWFLHYYVPTEQKKVETWKIMVPALKTKSEMRISKNSRYLDFIRKLKGEPEMSQSSQEKGKKDEDYQMMEAVNVLKDMIEIEEKTKLETK